MALKVRTMKRWLDTLPDYWSIGIDPHGALIIRAVEDPGVYFTLGGLPEDEDDDTTED